MGENEPLMTVRDIARLLSISTGAVRKRASRGSIPGAVFVGGALYFNPTIIRLWTDPRETGVRNRAREMATITIRPWPGTTNDKEWEVDIRYAHPTMLDAHGKAKRLRKRCQQVGSKSAVEKWAQAYVSAEITRLASGAVAGWGGDAGEPAEKPSTPSRGKIPTLAEFFPQYLDYMRSNGLKERSIEWSAIIYRNHLQPLLGDCRLDKIGIAEVELFKSTLVCRQRGPRSGKAPAPASEGKALRASSVNQFLRKLATILNVAKYLEIITKPPVIRYMKEPKTERQCYSFDEACAFVKAAEDRLLRAPTEAKRAALQDLAIVLCLLDTGIRVGELVAIHPEHVDLASKTLHVRLTVSGPNLTLPKGNRERAVPITSRLARVLHLLLAQTPGPRLFMRMHKRKKTPEPFSTQAVWDSLNRTLSHAGFPTQPGNGTIGRGPHRWRHTAATLMLESGVDVPTVQKILGHADIKETVKYLHLSGESMQRGSALYEARFTRGRHAGDVSADPPPALH